MPPISPPSPRSSQEGTTPVEPQKHKFGVHPDVLKLGLVSFLTDLSSEMIFSVFAIFFTTVADKGSRGYAFGVHKALDKSGAVLLYALFNISCVLAAPLIGKLSDRLGRPRMILLGYLTYSLLSLGFALASSQWLVVVLFVAYGVFYAIDEAQNKAFIADLELERRASAMGMYNFVTGMIYLPASLVAGALWLLHPASAFYAAAGLALAAMAVFMALRPDCAPKSRPGR